MRFHVGSDHGGVELRRVLVDALREWGHPVLSEMGPASPEDRVDYPGIAVQVCERVLRDRNDSADVFGLLICGSGQGMAMTANRIAGIRAGVVADSFSASMVRAHNDANVLCLGQRVLGAGLAKQLLRCFVDAEFEGGRHIGRIQQIELESRTSKPAAREGS